MKGKKKKIRLTIEMPAAVDASMKAAGERVGAASNIEVIRRALSLFDMLTEAQSKGQEILLRNGDTSERVVLI